MKKKMLFFAICLMMAAVSASAQEFVLPDLEEIRAQADYKSSFKAMSAEGLFSDPDAPPMAEDLYYHANPDCYGAENRYQSDSKFPCPICVQEDFPARGKAVARGGTIIMEMPDNWMASKKEETSGIFAFTSTDEYKGEKGREKLAEILHGNAYNDFLKEYKSFGRADADARTPWIYPLNDELFMNERHIGGAWYIAMRPNIKFKDELIVHLRFAAGEMWMQDDILYVDQHSEWNDSDYNLRLEKLSDEGAVFTKEFEGLTLTFYKEIGVYVCVVYENNADKDLLEGVILKIGDEPDIILNGYIAGNTGIYCCVLSDAEADYIMNGGNAALIHKPYYTQENYHDTAYAVVEKGTGGWGVIDRAGNFILGPGFRDITRYKNTVFTEDQNGNLEVVNLDSMQTLAVFKKGKGFINERPLNDAVFAVEQDHIWYIYDLDTGKSLAVLPVGEKDSPTYSAFGGIEGAYYGYQVGKPQRLVFWATADEDNGGAGFGHCWIADNEGNRISGNFRWMESLIWNGDNGVFAVSEFDYEEHTGHPNNDNKYLEGYDGREWFGKSWRVGLVDENGNTLAETEYVYIKALSPNEVLLRKADGTEKIVKVD